MPHHYATEKVQTSLTVKMLQIQGVGAAAAQTSGVASWQHSDPAETLGDQVSATFCSIAIGMKLLFSSKYSE